MKARALANAAILFSCAAFASGCDGRPASTSSEKSADKKHSGPKVAVLDIAAGAPEVTDGGFLGIASRHRSFDEFIEAASEIEKDKDTRAVFVKFGDAQIGIARAEEIGDRLAKIREKIPVYCHAHGYTNATMFAAARGCTKIVVSPSGEVEVIGIAAQVVYLRKLLADTLKIDIDFLQVGKFKGAEEPLTRDGPSPEARESLESVLRDLRERWLAGTNAGREKSGQKSIVDALEDGPYGPQKAKAAGLVDEVGYADDTLDALKEKTGAVRSESFFGKGAEADRPDDLDDLVRLVAGEGDSYGPIALVRASGSISMEGGSGLFGGRGGITEKDLDPILAELAKDDSVKAVVLRIDSPGGSALASDLLWHRLMKIREKKPLIVSIGDMAASGGYYLASTGNVIFAEPTSIVGSIGVVGGKLGFGKALEGVGVHSETFPASTKPGAAARAAYGSALTPWDEPTRAKILDSMTEVYELFLARVSEGRKIPVETVALSAEGRIFSGRQGKDRKLVDELGGLTEAIAKAREMAKLGDDARVVAVTEKSGVLDSIAGGSSARANAVIAQNTENTRAALLRASSAPGTLEGAALRIAPSVQPFAENMLELAEGEKMLTAMPYALQVR